MVIILKFERFTLMIIVILNMTNFKNLKWGTILFMTLAHILAFYGIQIFYDYYKQSWAAFLQILTQLFIMIFIGGLGITVGAHRLWTHRSFKAKLPTRIMIMVFNSFCYFTI